VSAIIADVDVGYCRCFCCFSLLRCYLLLMLSLVADVDAPRARLVLLSELDAAGHTDALEIPLLLSSEFVAADI
jgi:hypothetical protein